MSDFSGMTCHIRSPIFVKLMQFILELRLAVFNTYLEDNNELRSFSTSQKDFQIILWIINRRSFKQLFKSIQAWLRTFTMSRLKWSEGGGRREEIEREKFQTVAFSISIIQTLAMPDTGSPARSPSLSSCQYSMQPESLGIKIVAGCQQ